MESASTVASHSKVNVKSLALLCVLAALSATMSTVAYADCSQGFAYGTDAWGVQGCLNVGYQCPPHGSWSVRDGKCDCLPSWPVWNDSAKQCFAAAGSPCPDGYGFGTDYWGVQGCISTYQCPSGGSWSVNDNKCDCKPDTPFWDEQNKLCRANTTNPGEPLAQCTESVTYHDPSHENVKRFCGMLCPAKIDCVVEGAFGKLGCAPTAAIPVVGGAVALVCGAASTAVTEYNCSQARCHCGCFNVPLPKEKCVINGKNVC